MLGSDAGGASLVLSSSARLFPAFGAAIRQSADDGELFDLSKKTTEIQKRNQPDPAQQGPLGAARRKPSRGRRLRRNEQYFPGLRTMGRRADYVPAPEGGRRVTRERVTRERPRRRYRRELNAWFSSGSARSVLLDRRRRGRRDTRDVRQHLASDDPASFASNTGWARALDAGDRGHLYGDLDGHTKSLRVARLARGSMNGSRPSSCRST